MKTLSNFLKETNTFAEKFMPRPRVVCNDGFNVSIQAGCYLYSRPSYVTDGYLEVELGFPSEADPLIIEYAEDPSDPTGTVYGYVPIHIVEKLIHKHGGIK